MLVLRLFDSGLQESIVCSKPFDSVLQESNVYSKAF